MNINNAFVDVDFPADPNFVFGDMGAPPSFMDFGPSYEDKFGVMSENEIREAVKKSDDAGGSLDLLVVNIFNQGREGSCVANAYSQAHQIVQAEQFGKDKVVKLSAISLYKQIGSSPSSGANVGNGFNKVNSVGILPLDTPENRSAFKHVMPATGFYEKYPNGWQETAKLFRGHEGHKITSIQGLKSALCSGHPVVVGRSGHSICYTRLMIKGRDTVVKYANSWGNWGDNGFGYDSESMIRQSASYCFAIRSVTVRKGLK